MENISVNCLISLEKAVKGNLLVSGVSNLADLKQANLSNLTSDIDPIQAKKMREIVDQIEVMQTKWQKKLEKPLENSELGEERKTVPRRESIYLVKNLISSDSEYTEEYFLDEVFGCGEITEIVGPTGCGKTQIAMQLCLNVQTPKFLGGQEGKALFVDTNGDFTPERLLEMAKCFRMKLSKAFSKDKEMEEKYRSKFTEDSIMDRVYHYRILDEEDQSKFLYSLEKILKHNPDIKLIVLDTLNILLKSPESNYNERKRVINNVLVHFQKLAKQYGICFVLINILKNARRFNRDQEQQNKLEPQYGEILFQSVTNRVHIDRASNIGDDIFKAHLMKGSIFYQRNAAFDMHFQIKESGVSSHID